MDNKMSWAKEGWENTFLQSIENEFREKRDISRFPATQLRIKLGEALDL